MYEKIVIIILATAATFISIEEVFALKNPSVVYCEKMGYEIIVKETAAGETGICKFSETESCPAWDFLTGNCGKEYGYCGKEGYEIKTISAVNSQKCSTIPFSPQCAVCVLGDKTEVEVTKLMGLSFNEGVCGDGRCVLGESYETCSQDCPSGFFDNYCDGAEDDLCDPDCASETDSDCIGKLVYIDVAVCADKNCFQKKEFFTQDETAYFKINSDFTNFDISSTIKNSRGEIKRLTFKNNLATFQSDEAGTFSLWVDFSENGQLKSRAKKLFFYTEKPAKTSSVPVCNINGKCEGEENERNCPQDCLSAAGNKNTRFYILAAAILLAIGIAGFIFYRKNKNKKFSNDEF